MADELFEMITKPRGQMDLLSFDFFRSEALIRIVTEIDQKGEIDHKRAAEIIELSVKQRRTLTPFSVVLPPFTNQTIRNVFHRKTLLIWLLGF